MSPESRSVSRSPVARLTALLPGVLFAVCLLSMPPAAAAEIYKWVDAAGKVHYGDRPNEAGGGQKLDIDGDTPAPDPAQVRREDRSRKLLQDIDQDRREQEAKAAKQRAKAEKRKKNCAIAQQRLSDYEHASFLYQMDKNGERRIMNDAEYAKVMAQSRKDVANWCGPASDDR